MTDPADLLLLASLSNLAYEDDVAKQNAGVEALGYRVVCPRYENSDHRAFLCRTITAAQLSPSAVQDNSRTILVLCGTRFSDGNLPELRDDGEVFPYGEGHGAKVAYGFHKGLDALYAWALANAGGRLDVITGHSLGGARAHLAPIFVPKERLGSITSFGAPKAGNQLYWDSIADVNLTRVVHGLDAAVGWPALTLWGACQPQLMTWLVHGSAIAWTEAKWPGGLNPGDHAIEDGYAAALQALTAERVAA